MQHVECKVKTAIHVFSTNKNGYILAMKRLKYMSGEKYQITQPYISKPTRRKPISNYDGKFLLEYYYTICGCVVTLKQFIYVYDLRSSDVLIQIIRILVRKFLNKWAEHCFKIKKTRNHH